MFRQWLSKTYHSIAIFLLSTIIVLLLLNVCLAVFFSVKDSWYRNPVAGKYGEEILASVYPNMSVEERNDLLNETLSRPFLYEPFTQFKERPHTGRYVNVDKAGFRISKNQGEWPPQSHHLNIFLFGGSTTFGYGVADNQTIASYLQEHLTKELNQDVRVYNFGRGSYYSTQERILFEQLLAKGFIPDMAVFIDGLNEFYYPQNSNMSHFPDALNAFIDQRILVFASIGLGKLPMVRAARELNQGISSLLGKSDNLANNSSDSSNNSLSKLSHEEEQAIIQPIMQNYLANKKMIEGIAQSFGIQPVFIWQPVPNYKYDQRYHPFAKYGYGKHWPSKPGYEKMAEYLKQNPLGDNFLWYADVQQNLKKPLYVDIVHYSPFFSELLAKNIGNRILEERLLNASLKKPISTSL